MSSSRKWSGKLCAVIGCNSSQKQLGEWKKSECDLHPGLLHENCSCNRPFRFHRFPRNEELKRAWLIAINRKDYNPGKYAVVCTKHFIDGRRTERNPCPSLMVNYNPNNHPQPLPVKEERKSKSRSKKSRTEPPCVTNTDAIIWNAQAMAETYMRNNDMSNMTNDNMLMKPWNI